MNYGMLDHYLVNFDIICLSETLTDDPDLTNSLLSDYKAHVLEKESSLSCRYGGYHGLCVLMREEIFSKSTRLKADLRSKSIIWLQLDKEVLGFECVLRAVYLPHENSVHYKSEIFDDLSSDLLTLITHFDLPICLNGDFNSRTSTYNDFLIIELKLLA